MVPFPTIPPSESFGRKDFFDSLIFADFTTITRKEADCKPESFRKNGIFLHFVRN